MTQIVVAAQNIPRGTVIKEADNAVMIRNWPIDSVPEGAITDLDRVYGRVSRSDVVLGTPILEDMLATKTWETGAMGSDAALQVPPGKVAYAVPAGRYSSAAWALQPGDHVDVIMSLLVADLDEEFQSILPNNATCMPPVPEGGCPIAVAGRLEILASGLLVNLTPSEPQRPRLVTQLTVQDVPVLQIGDWVEPQEITAEGEVVPIEEAPVEGEATPPPPTPPVRPLTLAVSRQEAMVLEFAQSVGARFTFVLRSAGDTATDETESVTLEYLMRQYAIELPPKLPYGVTPPLLELAPIGVSESTGRRGSPGSEGE
jgi:pilus assembly protein CpaB